jgi:hypothetical protein
MHLVRPWWTTFSYPRRSFPPSPKTACGTNSTSTVSGHPASSACAHLQRCCTSGIPEYRSPTGYPTATAEGNAYIRRAIKIESGAKSAPDRHAPVVARPYVADDLPNLDLAVGNVTTVYPGRAFWDNVIILHGLRRWWDHRGELKGGGQRVSRHYYDVYDCWLRRLAGRPREM